MKQLLQNIHTGETVIAEVPIQQVQAGMALVRTQASLVSAGTERMLVEFAEKNLVGKALSRPDLVNQVVDKARREGVLSTIEAAFTRLDQPMPLGYSSAGVIEAVGEGLKSFKVGDRVACAGGGYAVHAEYELVPQNLLALLPEQVDFESAAFTTLGAIALHGFRLVGAQLGESVGVIGLGLLGLLTVLLARAAGCQVFGVDLDESRVRLAKELGATATLRENAALAALAFSHGCGLDNILICADTPSNDPVELAGEIARDRGRVVAIGAVGLSIPRKVYYTKELSFINSRSYGPGRYDPTYEEGGLDYPIGYVRWTEGRNLEAFVSLLAEGRVDVKPLITHRFPIAEAPSAYELITGKSKQPFLGVLLTYPDTKQITKPPKAEEPVIKSNLPVTGVNAVRLGVIGAGNFANAVMLPAIKKLPEIELVSITSGSGYHAHYATQKFGFKYTAESEHQILQDPQINTVAILTRHHLHAEQVIRALQAGKHVFCEKPLATTREQLAAIKQELLSREVSPLLMVGFNRRFAPFAQTLNNFISPRSEPLVATYRINAGNIPLTHWVQDPIQGGGRIIGEACHFIDFITFLVGSPPVMVTATALPDDSRYREDNVAIILIFKDGSIGTITYLANGDKVFPKERIEVFSGGKVGVLDDFRQLELVAHGKRKVIHSRLRQDKGHRAEWHAFSKALIAGSTPPIPYDQLFAVTEATFAAIDALHSQKTILLDTASA
ncbi:MAG: oxidoreductase [Anaerolineales bacterium]|nr:MAG: oxidoreductase [Anaerolineales bacterium]